MELRRTLDLYANILHCVSIPTVPARRTNLDLVLIRENTEGEYSGIEHTTVQGVVESLKVCCFESLLFLTPLDRNPSKHRAHSPFRL